jgi:aryl-alcohol dehydrogenase-like predicted oxidoreductase
MRRGINFDTADRYGSEPGETETIIGNWFVSRGGWRERTGIATKVYGEMGSCPNEGKVEETWQAIEVPVQAGKILYAGSSNFAGWQIVWSRPGLRILATLLATVGVGSSVGPCSGASTPWPSRWG